MITARSMPRPLEAFVALRRLMANPQDTEQAFRVVQALDGLHVQRLFERFRKSAGGARLLAERPNITAILSDREALMAMPEGSFGRAYLEFCDREGITAGGLVEASEIEGRNELEPDVRYMADRLRDTHDLWHVLTGYRTDLFGENSVLAFSAAQVGGLGLAALATAGYARSFQLPKELGRSGRALVRAAWERGRKAEWLPAQHFETLLPLPLSEVRARLGLSDAPSYRRVTEADYQAAA
jgi:ubiquinone biosynthesis protein COQ4